MIRNLITTLLLFMLCTVSAKQVSLHKIWKQFKVGSDRVEEVLYWEVLNSSDDLNNSSLAHRFSLKKGHSYCMETSTNIEEFEKEEVRVYPNPTSDIIFLKNIAERITLINNSGQIVYAGNNLSSLDLSSLPNGMYVAQVVLSSRSFFTQVVKL